jgi:DNA-binding transcriptional LysR family regulator
MTLTIALIWCSINRIEMMVGISLIEGYAVMNAPLNHPLPLLDLDVLRTFVAIAETGSFTTASSAVFRTPSAVSMQIKKLEDILGRSVFSRDARSVSLTPDGEMLLGYARRMLAINREAVSKFIIPDISGVVRLGSPDDYGERVLPHVLKRFAQSHPSVAVDVIIDQSSNLRRRMDDRGLDITLVTASYKSSMAGGEVLLSEPIVWAGAKGGCAHMREPLPVSLWEEGCAWRAGAVEALGREGRNYRVAYMSAHTAGQRSAIMADLAVAPLPKSFLGTDMVELTAKDGLPEIGNYSLGMYVAPDADAPVQAAADHIRATFETFRETGKF